MLRFSLAALAIVSIGIVFGFKAEPDTFASYRDSTKKPLAIKSKKLNYFAEEARLIEEKLKLDLSVKERSILSGLHWVVGLMDDEKKLRDIFADFLLMIDSLTNSRGRIHQREVAIAITKKSLKLAQNNLGKFFDKEEASAWRFLGLLPMLVKYPTENKKYFAFYKKQWPDFETAKPLELKEIKQAIDKSSFQELFDALVITSFPHYYRIKSKKLPVLVPQDVFPSYLREYAKLNYKDFPLEDPKFRMLGYLVTHIPLVLTNYCEYQLPKNEVAKKAHEFIESSFKKARLLGDFDLYAEYILSLKMFGAKKDRVADMESFIYDLQHPDGSWGSERDFTTSSYTAIHPSGAALMALNCDKE